MLAPVVGAVTGPTQTALARYAMTGGKNPANPLVTPWRLKNEPLTGSPVKVAVTNPPLYGGIKSTSKQTRNKRRKRWPKGWHGFTPRLAGRLGRKWSKHHQALRGMTLALSQALTFANTTEKRTKQTKRNENSQIRKCQPIRAWRLNPMRHPCGMETKTWSD